MCCAAAWQVRASAASCTSCNCSPPSWAVCWQGAGLQQGEVPQTLPITKNLGGVWKLHPPLLRPRPPAHLSSSSSPLPPPSMNWVQHPTERGRCPTSCLTAGSRLFSPKVREAQDIPTKKLFNPIFELTSTVHCPYHICRRFPGGRTTASTASADGDRDAARGCTVCGSDPYLLPLACCWSRV